MNLRHIAPNELEARLTRLARHRNRIARMLVTVVAAVSGIASAESVVILQDGDISSWKEKRFKGSTIYETVAFDGRTVLRAASNGTASGVFRNVRIDLRKTPILRWSWRIEKPLDPVDERTRNGDDYGARIYVIRKHPLLFWKTRALNYVWSSSLSKGADWPNAHTRAVHMVAVRSGTSEAGRWMDERRDVRTDFRDLFGRHVRHIDGVALMTDTDNAGGAAVAYYGDIRFASE